MKCKISRGKPITPIRTILSVICITISIIYSFQIPVLAGPKSTNYEFKDYSFNGSGKESSANYSLQGEVGNSVAGKANSANYQVNDGLSFTINSQVPPAPTLTNGGGSFYNKFGITLTTGSNPSDTKFVIAVSPDAFATTKYVQADDTLGTNPVFQTNTIWGASGFTVIGLTPGTTYSVKVSAMHGDFSQSAFGPVATIATSNPSLSFSFSPNSVNIGTLTPASVVTAPSTVTVNVDTNGTGGAVIYVYDTNAGLTSPSNSSTISSATGDLAVISEGYGIRGSSVTQSSGGPMQIVSPYNGSGANIGLLSSTKRPLFDTNNAPVTTGQAVFEIKAKSSATTKAGTDYADTITLITSATF